VIKWWHSVDVAFTQSWVHHGQSPDHLPPVVIVGSVVAPAAVRMMIIQDTRYVCGIT
jgi:hypothetical protein